ncbi:MAG: 4Fe-4S binding protein [Staphylococcus sp.]|nr:4Fe-4S binding protein [Staphylococcus sp.]
MSIYSFSFSPTGTSAKILSDINEGISGVLNTDISFRDLTFHPVEDIVLSPDDIIIVAAPVYGGKIAPIVKDRLKGIVGNNAKCVVVAVYGNRAFENAVVDFASFMSDSGCLICGAATFIGEHSYSTADTPIASGRPDQQDMAAARAFGKEIALKIRRDELCKISPSSLTDEPSPMESMINFRNFVIGYQQQQAKRPVTYLPEVDTSLCDDCGSCYDTCPTGAITPGCEDADPTKCIKCCVCVKVCPQGARRFFSPFAQTLSENFNIRKSPVWIV